MSNFDQHIKDQFHQYSPDVPLHIWDNIMAKRERRPKGFWITLLNTRNLMIAAGLLLTIGTSVWLLLQTPHSTTILPVDSASSHENAISNNTNIPSEPKQTTANTTPLNNDAGIATPVDQVGISSPLPDARSNQAGTTSLFSGVRKNFSRTRVKTSSPNGSEWVTSDDFDSNELTENKLSGFGPMGRLYLELNNPSTLHHRVAGLQERKMPNVVLPGCPTIEENAAGNKTYLEFYGSPDRGFQSFSDTGVNSAYLQSRKASTKFSSAFSAGIRYTRVFNNGMSLRTGLNYSQINEKFTLVQGNIVQVTYIINAQGDTTGSYTVTGTRYKTTYNKYRTLDIPLIVGYELGNGKLHANLNAGAIVNVYSWQKGDVLDAAGNPVNITTGKNSASPYGFKTNIGIGFTGGVSVYYKITDKLHLLAEPYYRHNLSSMNKDNLTLKQKYNTAGIKLGLRFDLK